MTLGEYYEVLERQFGLIFIGEDQNGNIHVQDASGVSSFVPDPKEMPPMARETAIEILSHIRKKGDSFRVNSPDNQKDRKQESNNFDIDDAISVVDIILDETPIGTLKRVTDRLKKRVSKEYIIELEEVILKNKELRKTLRDQSVTIKRLSISMDRQGKKLELLDKKQEK